MRETTRHFPNIRVWLICIAAIFAQLQCSSANSQRRSKSQSVDITNVKAGRECDMRKDVLLMNDPDPVKEARTFLQCRPAGRGMIGFWQRMLCPEGQKFEYDGQMCAPFVDESAPNASGQDTSIYVAIAGQDCSRGQECVGGSLCDPDRLECVCPENTEAEAGTYICQPLRKKLQVINIVPTQQTISTPVFPSSLQPLPQVQPQQYQPPSVSPGSSCKYDEVCSGNSYCNPDYFVCTCPENTIDRGGNCVPTRAEKVPPGGACDRLQQCESGSNCIQGRCICASPTVQMGERCVMKIRRSVDPGQQCDLGQYCIGGSVCSSVTKRCMCPVGTSQSGQECVDNRLVPADRSGVGAICEGNSECIIGAYCDANNYPTTCQCLSTHVEVRQTCYRIIYPGQTGCDFDSQCSAAFEGATCRNNACACPNGMNAQGQTCRPVRSSSSSSSSTNLLNLDGTNTSRPGEPCFGSDSDRVCSGGASCYMGLCVCPYGQLAFAGECVVDSRYSTIGGPCTAAENCTANSVCADGVCICPYGTDFYRGVCTDFEKLEVQNKIEEIRIEQSRVTMSLVPAPFAPGLTNRFFNNVTTSRPLPEVKIGNRNSGIAKSDILATPLGFFCLPNQTACAGGNGTCVKGLCDCPPGYIAHNFTCLVESVSPGETCQGGQRCRGHQFECINEKCECKAPGDAVYNNACVPKNLLIEPGRSCGGERICVGNSKCINRTCQCGPDAALAGGKCRDVLFIPIGEQCSPLEACAGGAGCINSVCECRDGSVNNRGICEQIPGGKCSDGQKCVGGSTCQFGTCKCPGGRESIGNTCQPKKAKPGDPCENGESCNGGSRCIFGACLCPPDQIQIGELCQRSHVPVNPGQNCSNGEQCQGGSYCAQSVCRCPGTQIVVKNVCQQGVSRPGESCRDAQRCLGGSVCQNFVCQCETGQVVANGECMTPVDISPGNPCQASTKCIGRSTCIEGVCRCPVGETISNNQCQQTFNPVLPGEQCGRTPVTECTRESFCFSFICACQTGMSIINGQCSVTPLGNVAYPGQSCAAGQLCLGGSNCVNRVCTCPDGKDIVEQTCQSQRKQPSPGQACEIGDTCTGGSSCTNRLCQCPNGQIISGVTCINFLANPEQACLPVQQCSGGSNCIGGVCKCPPDYDIINEVCMRPQPKERKPGESCAIGEICSGGSSCIEQLCQCPAGQIAMDGICQPKPLSQPGESCANGQSCTGGSECISQVCRCKVNEVVVEGACIGQTAGPGETCAQGQVCTGGSRCFASVCQCPPGQTPVDSLCVKIKTARPGESCAAKEICLGGSSCSQNFCQCSVSEIISNDQCIPKTGGESGPGEPCNSGQVCLGFSVCVGATGFCECPPGTIKNDRICVPKVRDLYPGENCSPGEECLYESSCVDSVCTCPPGKMAVDRQCQQILARPGDFCGTGEKCTGNSRCVNKYCLCPETTVSFSGKCIAQQDPGRNPGQTCTNGQQCRGGSNCINGKCVCPFGTQVVLNLCVRTSLPGEDCAQGQPCMAGSTCVSGVCTCPTGTINSNGVCTPIGKKSPGETCNEATQCTNNAFCNAGTCKCIFGFTEFERRCVDNQIISPPGGVCTAGKICVGGSLCRSGTCICPASLVVSNGRCTEARGSSPPGGSCAQGQICVGNSICRPSDRICSCRVNTIPVAGKCLERAAPEQPCSADKICTGGSACKMGICQCPGPTTAANGLCLPTRSVSNPGASCFKEELCRGNAVCRDSACVCPPGLNVVNDQCMSPVINVEAGGYCSYTSQCGFGLTCLFGVCQCSKATTYCPGGGRMTSPPGGSCAALQECTGGSRCRDGWCLCPNPSMVVTNGQCINAKKQMASKPNRTVQQPRAKASINDQVTETQVMPPGGYCGDNYICSGGSFCASGQCLCPEGMEIQDARCITRKQAPRPQPQPQPQIRQQLPRPLERCGSIHQRCSGGAVCDGRVCQCPIGTMLQNGQCVNAPEPRASPPYGSCSKGEDCSGNSFCDGDVCQCPRGTIVIERSCRRPPNPSTRPAPVQINRKRSAMPTESCANGEQCLGGSRCDQQNRVCQCPRGTKAMNGQCQIPVRRPQVSSRPNGPCSSGQKCTGGSRCFSGVCVCPKGTEPDRFGTCRGSGVVQINSPCHANSKCAGGAVCISGRCRCAPGTIQQGGSCITLKGPRRSVPAGGRCGTGDDCVGLAQCINAICVCPQGTMTRNGICIPAQVRQASLPGQSCSTGNVCVGGSRCVQGQCQCVPGFEIQDGQCVRAKFLKQNSSDILRSRRAVKSSSPDTNNKKSYLEDPFYLSAMATRKRTNTGVFNDLNRLSSDHLPSMNLKDSRYSVPGELCSKGQLCMGGSICYIGYCVCPYFTRSFNMRCLGSFDPAAFSSPGDPCNNGGDCTGGSYCRLGFCVCPLGTESVNLECVPPNNVPNNTPLDPVKDFGFSSPGHKCSNTQKCTGRSYCVDGMCHCPAGMSPRNGVCEGDPLPNSVESRNATQPRSSNTALLPGDACQPGQICEGGALCSMGVCKCPSGYSVVNEFCIKARGSHIRLSAKEALIEKRPPGTVCDDERLCTGGAMCIGGVCTCPEKTVAVGPTCQKIDSRLDRLFAPLQKKCNREIPCFGGSKCVDGFCRCSVSQISYEGKCITIPERITVLDPLLEMLYPIRDSFSKGIAKNRSVRSIRSLESSTPVNSPQPFPQEVVSTLSIASDEKYPGEPCNATTHCLGSSSCLFGKCTCPPGSVSKQGFCQMATKSFTPFTTSAPTESRPGDSCSEGVFCVGGSYCDRGTCVCPPGTTNLGRMCGVSTSNVPTLIEQGPQSGPPSSIRQSQKTRTGGKARRMAEPCPLPENPTACQLPNCYCSKEGTDIPGGLPVQDTPQMVVITLDDAVNGKTINVYKNTLFDGRYTNPNGCPVKATFMVSHEWTNYDDVQWLYYQGHEISSNSISHKNLFNKPYDTWVSEMNGLREIAAQFATVDQNDIIGMRAPQLGTGSDTQFQMMVDNGFKWDNSITAKPGREGPPFWPQTLDYALAYECQRKGCPTGSFPGVWEIPLNQFYGYYLPVLQGYKRASMIRAALDVNATLDSTLQLLRKNFERAYNNNRAPYILTINADFLNALPDMGGLKALEIFLQELQQNPNVWTVTMSQMIEWMQNPTPLSRLQSFGPFQCAETGMSRSGKKRKSPCTVGNICNYQTPDLISGEHQMRTCGQCPKQYPWVNNPAGRKL